MADLRGTKFFVKKKNIIIVHCPICTDETRYISICRRKIKKIMTKYLQSCIYFTILYGIYLHTENYSKKKVFALANRGIIYSVKTQFLKKTCYVDMPRIDL